METLTKEKEGIWQMGDAGADNGTWDVEIRKAGNGERGNLELWEAGKGAGARRGRWRKSKRKRKEKEAEAVQRGVDF
jgi:hypothetical protein